MNQIKRDIQGTLEMEDLKQAIKQREAELSLINSIQEAINSEVSMQGIYDLVGDKIRVLLDAQVVGIYTIDLDKDIEYYDYLYEDGERLFPKPGKLNDIKKLVINTKKSLLIDQDLPNRVFEISGKNAIPIPGTRLPKSMLFVPMLVKKEVLGYVSIQNLDREEAFSPADIQLLETITNSMSLGLGNAQLLNETEQRNAELAVINSVQQGLVAEMDMQGIYDLVGDRIQILFDAQVAAISTFDYDKNIEQFHYVFEDGGRIYPESRPIDRLRSILITEKKVIYFNENIAEKELELTGELIEEVPGTKNPKSYLLVPLLIGDTVRGYVTLQNLDRENAFSDSDVRLLLTLSNSMSVALENARLFNETEQRNAELAVINSVQQGLVAEMDMQGIYDLVGEKIRSLFDAQVVAVATFDHKNKLENFHYIFEDGERFNLEPRSIDKLREHLIESQELLYLNENVDQLWTEITGETPTVIPGTKFTKSALYVPMLVGKKVRGYVSLQNVDRENAFSDSDIRLLSTLANSMTVALENARLFNETTRLLDETKQRATELETVNKISHALVSQLEFKALIKLIGEQMRQTFNADIVYLALHDRETNMLHFPYMYGEEDTQSRIFGNGITEKIILKKEPLLINQDMEKAYDRIEAEKKGKSVQSYLGVPIIAGDNAIGVISVQSTEKQNRFTENDMRLLKTIAANVGVAMQNAEAYEKLQVALDDLGSAQEQLIQQEKLASLGQLAAGIAHEIKNPLNFVNNFSELNIELIDEVFEELEKLPKGKEVEEIQTILKDVTFNLKKIHQHGSRADSIVKSMLQHSRGSNGIQEPIEINELIKEYINLAFHGMRAGRKPINVSIDFQLDDNVGKVSLIGEDFSRVILNLCNNAFDAMHDKHKIQKVKGYEPKLSVRTYSKNKNILLEIEDNGHGIPDGLKDKIMQPFFTTKKGTEGTGLGLSITNDIIKAHGGTMIIESSQGENSFTKFKITLTK